MRDYVINILRVLLTRKCIGGRHTAIEHCLAAIPRHEHKKGKRAIKELIKHEFDLVKPTHYGVQVSLNPERLSEIKALLGRE